MIFTDRADGSFAEEFVRLAELRDRGDLSGEEFQRAKERLLAPPEPSFQGKAAAPDGALLLYHVVTAGLRRAAWTLVIIALLLGLAAAWSTNQASELLAQADAIEDSPLAEGFGITIPDPRSTIERAELRVRAMVYNGFAVVTGLMTAGTLFAALLLRPPRRPRSVSFASKRRS
jgi:hypothetical protein